MLKAERQNLILNELSEKEKVSTIELSLFLKVSEDSIRRDFNELHDKGLLRKVYGGALKVEVQKSDAFNVAISNFENKSKVGQKAIGLLKDDQVIIISGGTTNLAFAKLIPIHLKATIYTYSLPIALQLSQHPNIELIFIGGKLQKKAMVTVGIDVLKYLANIKADLCFMGTNGINVPFGLTEVGYEVSAVKQAMLEVSDQLVVLVTSEKLNSKMPHSVCELDKIAVIVTDLDPNSSSLADYKASGVRFL